MIPKPMLGTRIWGFRRTLRASGLRAGMFSPDAKCPSEIKPVFRVLT